MRIASFSLLLALGALAWAAPVGSPGPTPDGANPVCDDVADPPPTGSPTIASPTTTTPGCRPAAETFPVRPAHAPTGSEFGADLAVEVVLLLRRSHLRRDDERDPCAAGDADGLCRTLLWSEPPQKQREAA